MKTILIKNGLIIDSRKSYFSDIYIENNIIKKIESNLQIEANQIIDAKNKYVFAGAIDPHVHFNLSTFVGNTADDFISGSKAALYGGTTSVIDFVSPTKGESLITALENRKKEAEISLCNVYLHVTPSWWGEKTKNEIEICIKEFGIKSFKVYTAYKNGIGIDDSIILNVMQTVAQNNGIVTLHCENDELIEFHRKRLLLEGKFEPKYHPISRPIDAEVDAISRAIIYSKNTDCQIYIVHVSSKNGIELIEKAQKEGVKIFAETCPHYLLLEDSVFENKFEIAAKYVLSPPIRKKEDNESLWKAINSGVIQTIGTDHCSFNITGQKDFGINDFTKIVNGAGGVEHRLEMIYTYGVLENKISINKMIETCCENPAKIFNIKNKGFIKENFDADIIIWNPDFEKIISTSNQKQKCDNNIYEDFKTKGKAEIVILNGKII